MAEPVECEIAIVMDTDGDWIVRKWDDHLMSEFDDEIGGDHPRRVIKITAKMAPPVLQQAIITVPDEAGETITATAE